MGLTVVLAERWPYVFTIALLLIGLFGMMVKQNMMKKLFGMNIFQTAIILFFIVHAYKHGASVPVLDDALGLDPQHYVNPIPHGLMLTAIVVSVATTGVALALLVRIYRTYGTIDESELLARLRDDEEPR
jgi:multicomponent Na+:H+ antiporter subunit C